MLDWDHQKEPDSSLFDEDPEEGQRQHAAHYVQDGADEEMEKEEPLSEEETKKKKKKDKKPKKDKKKERPVSDDEEGGIEEHFSYDVGIHRHPGYDDDYYDDYYDEEDEPIGRPARFTYYDDGRSRYIEDRDE